MPMSEVGYFLPCCTIMKLNNDLSGSSCLTICARSLWGGRGVGPASQNRSNLLSRRCGPGGGVAFVFMLALALRACLLLCWRQTTQQEGALKA